MFRPFDEQQFIVAREEFRLSSILQKYRGRIWAEEEPDKRATLYFTCGAAETRTEPRVAVEEVV